MRKLPPALATTMLACTFAIVALSAHADMRISERNYVSDMLTNSITVNITGTITDRDAEQFQDISKDLEYTSLFFVNLDSTGGDVAAALKIGRLVRKYDGWTLIPEDAKCYSSCALIFIAGVSRFSSGELGVHRPYFSSAPQARETLEKQVPLMLSMIKSYMAEMGVTDDFYQQMVNTEPSQMVIYNQNDLTALLPKEDPTYAEIVVARNARMFGVGTSEMRRRLQDADSCTPPEQPVSSEQGDCMNAIKWGLSEADYREREARAKKACWFNDKQIFSEAERATLAETPTRLRADLPLYVRWETCERNIMLGQSMSERSSSWFGRLFWH